MMNKTKTIAQRKEAEIKIRERYQRLKDTLTERSRRLFAASEAIAFGYGGIAAAVRATGLSVNTVRRGLRDSQAIESGILVQPGESS